MGSCLLLLMGEAFASEDEIKSPAEFQQDFFIYGAGLLFYSINNGFKSFGVVHGQIGKDLAV